MFLLLYMGILRCRTIYKDKKSKTFEMLWSWMKWIILVNQTCNRGMSFQHFRHCFCLHHQGLKHWKLIPFWDGWLLKTTLLRVALFCFCLYKSQACPKVNFKETERKKHPVTALPYYTFDTQNIPQTKINIVYMKFWKTNYWCHIGHII